MSRSESNRPEPEPNVCHENPARKYADHCYHNAYDGEEARCCWCGYTVTNHRPGKRHGPHLPEWFPRTAVQRRRDEKLLIKKALDGTSLLADENERRLRRARGPRR